MKIAFRSFSSFSEESDCEEKLLSFLADRVGEKTAYMFFGGFNEFDSFAYRCCRKYSEAHSQVSLIFVVPMLEEIGVPECLKGKEDCFDGIICIELGDEPKLPAGEYFNRYITERADVLVTYVTDSSNIALPNFFEGNSEIFNLADVKKR